MARENDEEVSLANALIALGIARASGGSDDEDLALEDFEQARSGNSSLARLDLVVLDPDTVALAEQSDSGGEKRSSRREQIDGLSTWDNEDIFEAPDAIYSEVPRKGRGRPALTIYSRHSSSCKRLVINTGYTNIPLLSTVEGYAGTSGRGTSIGSGLEQVRDAYGQPSALVAGRQGTYHVYEHTQIIFQIDANGRVAGWMLYSIDE